LIISSGSPLALNASSRRSKSKKLVCPIDPSPVVARGGQRGRFAAAGPAPFFEVPYSLGFTNLFLRSSFGVMAPDLARELALEPAALSMVASAFFFAYAAMQVPTGMLLDRFGPRRTVATLLLFTAAGTALFATGQSATTLTVARLLMGIGCAGVFTGAFYVLTQWLHTDKVVSQVGALNSFAAIGTLCATTPFALLIASIGWRASYWIFAAGVIALMLAVAMKLREAPSGQLPRTSEGLVRAFAGVLDAIRQQGVKRLLVVGLPMSSAGTIAGVWGAPYLKDVHSLDDIGRGNVLLAMASCAIAGHFFYGLLARWLNTLKGLILAGSVAILGATATLAAVERPSLDLVTWLFCLIGMSAAYPALTHAHARGLVPLHLIGRGVSVTNMGVMTAAAIMQLAFGWIVGIFAATAGVPEHGYRAAFATQAAGALLAIAIYAPIRDVRPRG
jgi:MFS family permease